MADNENILTRLGKLFQSSIVLRKTNDGQVRVKDVDFTQTALTSNFIDRYNKIHSSGYGTSYALEFCLFAYDVPYPLELILLYLSIKLDVRAVCVKSTSFTRTCPSFVFLNTILD